MLVPIGRNMNGASGTSEPFGREVWVAFYGLFAGMAAVFLVSRLTSLAFLWYNVVGALTVFGVGLAISALPPAHGRREGAPV